MTRLARVLSTLILVSIPAPGAMSRASDGDGTVVFRRMESLVETVGVTEVRVVYGARIDVPLPGCEAPPTDPACRETRRFGQLVGISWSQKTRDGRTTTVEPRGAAVFALDLDTTDERNFLEALDETLLGLSPQAFGIVYAGVDLAGEPFDPDHLLPDPGTAWACVRDGDTVRLSTRTRTEHGTGRSSTPQPAVVEPTCGPMFAALEAAAPDVRTTRTAPTTVEVEEVRVLSARDLPGEIWPDRFPTLPERTVLGTSDGPPGVRAGSGRSANADGEVIAYVIDEGVRTQARVVPAHLPARTADHGAWAQRWTTVRRLEIHGAAPSSEILDRFDVVVGWIPVPERIGDVSGRAAGDGGTGERTTDAGGTRGGGPVGVDVDPSSLLAGIASRLGRESRLTAAVVDHAVTDRPSGLDSPGWLFVVCRPDGTASWGLAPTAARAPILEPAAICDEISSRVR